MCDILMRALFVPLHTVNCDVFFTAGVLPFTFFSVFLLISQTICMKREKSRRKKMVVFDSIFDGSPKNRDFLRASTTVDSFSLRKSCEQGLVMFGTHLSALKITTVPTVQTTTSRIGIDDNSSN